MKRVNIYVRRLDLMVERANGVLYFWIYLRISYLIKNIFTIIVTIILATCSQLN
jgi:hypothetical protein